MSGIITLTTDFGTADGYAAAMKGVILGINPAAQLIDISHGIQSQNISQAAFVLSTAYRFFPEGTVHLVVVDPGVGTARRAVILRTPRAYFVAPDNGVLSQVLWAAGQIQSRRRHPANRSRQRALPPGVAAVAITRPEFWRQPVSATFHGRDIFAPVAARLSLGANPSDFGEAVDRLRALPLPGVYREAGGRLVGHILHVDHFGNLITSLKGDDLPADRAAIIIEVGGRRLRGLSETYGEREGLKALVGSSGYLEIALSGGSAGAFLEVVVGGEVKISTAKQ
ncbi:MAG: SAM-dependent chlorinase/fluorinase [Chloroflexi bacterium]|nr:SAM-dependent chlorinase/fluorinase [Chloroflexota bacterium]